MSQEKKIAVIIPYFGQWPGWIDYFLHSCIANPTIDWIFPTDCQEPFIKGVNLKFLPFSLQEFNELSSRKLGLDIRIKHPYKICDLKPAYGEIFKEHLKDFDFWGYGDLDLVYGNIREFITDKYLDEYDIISNHPEFITGHFCLIRNTDEICELFRAGDAYKAAFTAKNYTGFDEQLKKSGINPNPKFLGYEQNFDRKAHLLRYRFRKKMREIIPKGDPNQEKKIGTGNLDDFTSIARNAEHLGKIKIRYAKTFESDLMLAKSGEKNWEVSWREGNLSNRDGKSLLYFHFILSKNKKSFKMGDYHAELSKFRISPKGINLREINTPPEGKIEL